MKNNYRIEFNKVVATQKEVEQHVRPYRILAADRKGKYTWKVKIKSQKDPSDIIANLKKRGVIRDVSLWSGS